MTLAGNTDFHCGSINYNFDPPQFPLDSTFNRLFHRKSACRKVWVAGRVTPSPPPPLRYPFSQLIPSVNILFKDDASYFSYSVFSFRARICIRLRTPWIDSTARLHRLADRFLGIDYWASWTFTNSDSGYGPNLMYRNYCSLYTHRASTQENNCCNFHTEHRWHVCKIIMNTCGCYHSGSTCTIM